MFLLMSRLPDEEAGQVPIAYIVCNPEHLVTEKQVLDFVAEQVWFFYMPALLSGVLQYLFSVSGLLDRFIGLWITLTTPPLALLLPLCNLDNNLEKNYVWKRLYWSGISQGYQTTRVVFVHWLCVCVHYWWCSWLNAWGVQVAPYKKLRRVTFLEAIPRSSSGKILRRELTQKPISKLWSGFVSKQFCSRTNVQ